ncbi:hypothetical protein DFH11DRAFT_270152 [Phellopilus nigrolimitatus]|nr:hypothetical protein DFH11DRAFT_270152 [Phellopilus nigrolimitatus]
MSSPLSSPPPSYTPHTLNREERKKSWLKLLVSVLQTRASGPCRNARRSRLPHINNSNSRCSARQSPLTTEALVQYLGLWSGWGLMLSRHKLSGQSPLPESGRTNGHATHESHTRVSQRARRLSDGKEQCPAVRFGGGMTDIGGGVPPLLPGHLCHLIRPRARLPDLLRPHPRRAALEQQTYTLRPGE